MPSFNPPLPPAWNGLFNAGYSQVDYAALASFVDQAYSRETVFPPRNHIFRALELVSPDQCRVVILGQDPYPSPGNAQGLSFSVPPRQRIPGSLVTIFNELQRSIPGWQRPPTGHLESWAKQGVLLLNTILTVKALAPMSHAGEGWEKFTRAVIRHLQNQSPFVVFLLWGAKAQASEGLVDTTKHRLLKGSHPSRMAQNTLPADRKFVGNGHFTEANRLLEIAGIAPIAW